MFGTNAFGWIYPAQGSLQAILSVSDTDAASASESASVTRQAYTASDSNGAVTENAAYAVSVVASDSNGAVAEVSSALIGVLPAADSGVANDTVLLAAKISVSDPQAGTYANVPSRFATYAAIPATVDTYAHLP